MCVIVFKPAGAAMPPRSVLKHCWDKNSDGAGLAISERKSVFVAKGFMTWKAFDKYLDENGFADDSRRFQAVMFHFRIGTAGLKDQGNTHPFCVSSDPEKIREICGHYQTVVAHNGVFRLEPKLPKISDTGQWIVDCAQKSGGDPVKHWNDNKSISGWSKLAVLKPAGEYELLGEWSQTGDHAPSCFFSNTTWKPWVSSGGYDWSDEGYRVATPAKRAPAAIASVGCGGGRAELTLDDKALIMAYLVERGFSAEDAAGAIVRSTDLSSLREILRSRAASAAGKKEAEKKEAEHVCA